MDGMSSGSSGTLSPEAPSAKRRRETDVEVGEDSHHITNNTSAQELLDDPINVTILVFPETFEEPKRLLCHNSKYFDKHLNGNPEEANKLWVVLEDVEPRSFELMIYYIYNNDIPHQEYETPSEEITTLIDFLVIADKMELVGASAVSSRSVLQHLETFEHITAEHIRKASSLPRKHVLRKAIADACVKEYMKSITAERQGGPGQRPEEFKFQKELAEMESFASDILFAYADMKRRELVVVGDPAPNAHRDVDSLEPGELCDCGMC